jgi:hypothetical protein
MEDEKIRALSGRDNDLSQPTSTTLGALRWQPID